MSQIQCEFKNDNQIIFFDFPFENQRKYMKLKILLNSDKNLKYSVVASDLVVDFLTNDKIIVGKEISKIIKFIESVFEVTIQMDSLTKDNIEHTTVVSNNFQDGYNRLKAIKKTDYTKSEEFIFFKKFCDDTLACKLRPYQYSASYFLTIGQGGFDFSVPGSGKTIISYSAYNFLKSKHLCDSVLIIGPLNSFNAWNEEYETCFDKEPDFFSVANLSKKDAEVYFLSSSKNHKEITFVNNDKAWRMKSALLSFMEGKNILLIVDEAHKEKNPEAEITKAVLEITKKAKYRIILTGTPMPNGYEDLYSLLKIYEPYEKVIPYSYSDLKKFTKNGATESQQNKIMEALKPVYSRVSKAYLLGTGELMLPKIELISCELSEEQQLLYDFLNKMAFELDSDFESILNQNLMKAILIRKMQISANPSLLSNSIVNSIEEYKNDYYEQFSSDYSESELLVQADNSIRKEFAKSEIANIIYKFENGLLQIPKNLKAIELSEQLIKAGESVILWDVFVQNMVCLKEMFEAKGYSNIEIINGTICGDDRSSAINRFRSGKSKVLIANPATLAESISLHKCCQNAIYVNRNFNAAQFIQSKDRIHRINMPKGKTANYYFLVNNDTVDQAVDEKLRIKENRMLKVLDSEELIIGGSDFENESFMSIGDVIDSYKR